MKGGTALMLCYGLDRFSEDIDFEGNKKISLENKMKAGLKKVNAEAKLSIVKDTETTQRIKMEYFCQGAKRRLKIEVSYRQGFESEQVKQVEGIQVFTIDQLIQQKINACLNRKTSRDFYDMAFLSHRYTGRVEKHQEEIQQIHKQSSLYYADFRR